MLRSRDAPATREDQPARRLRWHYRREWIARRAPASRYTSGPSGVRLTFAPGAVVSSSIAASRISHRAEGTAHGSRGSHGDPEGFVRSRCCVATETTPVAHVAWRPALVARRARRLLVRRAHPCRATAIVPENLQRCGESRMNCTHKPNLPVNLTRGCCEARRASRPPLAARRRALRCGARVNPAQVTGNSVRRMVATVPVNARVKDRDLATPRLTRRPRTSVSPGFDSLHSRTSRSCAAGAPLRKLAV